MKDKVRRIVEDMIIEAMEEISDTDILEFVGDKIDAMLGDLLHEVLERTVEEVIYDIDIDEFM